MKKAAVISLLIGLSFQGIAYYYSLKSLQLIEQNQEYDDSKDILNKNQKTAIEDEIYEIQQNDLISYQFLELSESDDKNVKRMVEQFNSHQDLDPLYSNAVVGLIEKDFGELGFIKAFIGSSIDYVNFSWDYSFLNRLFKEDASLSEKLTRAFLNKFRNPDQLHRAFEEFKAEIFQRIPKSLYEKAFEELLSDLLEAHQIIESQPDREAYFEELYQKANSQNLHRHYWAYTFWKRREIEKNDKQVYAILNEIIIYYDGH
ncbi:hypothetical protein [Algoriphagus sp. PAP.12]|uniref:hypothetical protein n=1 Tax=Algoriphagus sp. PAP.12 TaxID=2996678 RepID=UPI00227CF558|nr:hypothetical protein [Algoriphagus sp. PAP.12]